MEKSNPGYTFDEFRLADMRGKYIGIVLGEEEYISNKGEVKTKLVVVTTKTIQDIRDGNFTVPAKKLLAEKKPVYAAPAENSFASPPDDGPMPWDEKLPF